MKSNINQENFSSYLTVLWIKVMIIKYSSHKGCSGKDNNSGSGKGGRSLFFAWAEEVVLSAVLIEEDSVWCEAVLTRFSWISISIGPGNTGGLGLLADGDGVVAVLSWWHLSGGGGNSSGEGEEFHLLF